MQSNGPLPQVVNLLYSKYLGITYTLNEKCRSTRCQHSICLYHFPEQQPTVPKYYPENLKHRVDLPFAHIFFSGQQSASPRSSISSCKPSSISVRLHLHHKYIQWTISVFIRLPNTQPTVVFLFLTDSNQFQPTVDYGSQQKHHHRF